MEDALSNIPWIETYSLWKHSNPNHRFRRSFYSTTYVETYKATYEIVKDSGHCYWQSGDIVQFDVGYNSSYSMPDRNWRSWFMPWDDFLEYFNTNLQRNKAVPLYARGEFGIVLTRYRWVKEKNFATYRDYGSLIMMLTGSKKGHVRRYYSQFPYYRISQFPYTGIAKTEWNKSINEISYVFDFKNDICKNDTAGERAIFLINLYNELGGDYEPRRSS